MSGYVFLFELDAVITRQEMLPAICRKLGIYEQMCSLTERTVQGELPYKQSFLQKAELLKKVPLSLLRRLSGGLPLNEKLAEFIRIHRHRCHIVTVLPDVWIRELIEKTGMEDRIFCSRASAEHDYIQNIVSILDQNTVMKQMNLPCVAVGAGNYDAQIIQAAEIGIGYGGVRSISPAVLASASHAVYQEEKLVEFLERLL